MFGRNLKQREGTVDGGEGRDQRPPAGYNSQDEDWIEDLREFSDRDLGNDEEGGPDRRRDPLRR